MENYDIKYIFDNINDWLKFAEAKNGMLIAFDSAALCAIISLLKNNKLFCADLVYYSYLSLFLLVISIIVLLYSFVPQFSLKDKTSDIDIDKLNLTYFFDLAKLDYEEFEEKLANDFSLELKTFESGLLIQVINNSKIAVFKYVCFKIAVWLNLAILLTPFILLYPLIKYIKSKVKND